MELLWKAIDVPYKAGRFVIAGSVSTAARTVVLRARPTPTAAGPAGFGEAVPNLRVLGVDEATLDMRLRTAVRRLFGAPFLPEGDPPANPLAGRAGPAACALDGALLDLWARARGEPLWKALGLPPCDQPTSATVSLAAPDAMAKQARAHEAAGFLHLKLKLGEDAELDRARLSAVRAAVPRSTLRVDANEGWSLSTTLAMVPTLAGARVELLEQPLARDASVDDLRAVTAACSDHDVVHVLDEAVHEPAHAARVGTERLAHAVNLKLQKAGGLRAGQQLIATARAHGLGVMIGCFVETWAGIGLGVQLAGLVDWVDLDGAWLLARQPLAPTGEGFLSAGRVRTSHAHGLGVFPTEPLFPGDTPRATPPDV